MYTDSICAANVYNACNISGTYNVSNPTYQSTKYTEEIDSVFQGILDEVIEAETKYQAYYAPAEEPPEYNAASSAPPADTAPAVVSTYCPPPSVCSAVASTVEAAPTSAVVSTPETTIVSTPTNTAVSTPANPVTATPVSASTGVSYIDKYYTISEAEVVHEIRKIRHVINNADLSGKTDVEKYDWIENKFIDTFGKDFMMARNLSMPNSMFYMIGIEFNDTLGRHMENPEQVNRQRLFGDASTEEIQRIISAKYPDELTNRDLIMKVNEMRSAGVLDSNSIRSLGEGGVQRLMDTLRLLQNYVRFADMRRGGTVGPISLEERDRLWAEMLDNRANLKDVQFLHNLFKHRGIHTEKDAIQFLVDFTGGELDANGFFILPPGGSKNFDEEIKAVLASMDEYDELIRSRMAYIDSEEYVPAGAYGAVNTPGAEDGAGITESPGAEYGSGAEEVTGEYGSGAEESSAEYGSGAEEGSAESGGSSAEEYAGTAA
jgi:hypothetical protein